MVFSKFNKKRKPENPARECNPIYKGSSLKENIKINDNNVIIMITVIVIIIIVIVIHIIIIIGGMQVLSPLLLNSLLPMIINTHLLRLWKQYKLLNSTKF